MDGWLDEWPYVFFLCLYMFFFSLEMFDLVESSPVPMFPC